MVILTPKFTALLAFVTSSSMLAGVDALPYHSDQSGVEEPGLGNHFPLPAIIPRHDSPTSDMELRDHHHHHHHKGHHHHGDHETKVYADDPVIVSGDGNHVHTHSHKRRSHHKHHGHHGHHGTKVYADDPLIVSGDNNHVHAHSHRRSGLRLDLGLGPQLASLGTRKNHHHHHHHSKALEMTTYKRDLSERGLLDPLVPLAGSLPGVAGVIGLVNMVAHTVLSDTLANLIISPMPSPVSVQSVDGEQMPSYGINASNSSSTMMYLVAQNATANVGPSEQIVLVTTPMLNSTDQSIKMYCASYNPNSTGASQLSSQPCAYNSNAGLDINSTSTHFSQLFSWNIGTGEISPLWQRDQGAESTADAATTMDQASSADGYVVGGPAPGSFSTEQSGSTGKLAMVFKLVSSANNGTAAPLASSIDPSSVMTWSSDCDEADSSSQAEDDQSQSNASSDDYETGPSVASDDSGDDDTAPEDVQAYGDAASGTASTGPSPSPTNSAAAQEAAVVTSTFTMLIVPTEPAASSTGSVASPTPSP